MAYPGTRWKLIHVKNLNSKFSCQTPLNSKYSSCVSKLYRLHMNRLTFPAKLIVSFSFCTNLNILLNWAISGRDWARPNIWLCYCWRLSRLHFLCLGLHLFGFFLSSSKNGLSKYKSAVIWPSSIYVQKEHNKFNEKSYNLGS